jgi:hypothetical protein
MVYGLYRALPGEPGFLATVIGGITSANLTPASGCQDHTTSPSASALFVKSATTSTASRPYVRDDRETPLCVGRDGGSLMGDLGKSRSGIFFLIGLDDPNQLDPAQQFKLRAQDGIVPDRRFARADCASQSAFCAPCRRSRTVRRSCGVAQRCCAPAPRSSASDP